MYRVFIDRDKCEGCEECADSCPAGILGMEDGKATVEGDPTECMGCETCITVCPSGACTLEES